MFNYILLRINVKIYVLWKNQHDIQINYGY